MIHASWQRTRCSTREEEHAESWRDSVNNLGACTNYEKFCSRALVSSRNTYLRHKVLTKTVRCAASSWRTVSRVTLWRHLAHTQKLTRWPKNVLVQKMKTLIDFVFFCNCFKRTFVHIVYSNDHTHICELVCIPKTMCFKSCVIWSLRWSINHSQKGFFFQHRSEYRTILQPKSQSHVAHARGGKTQGRCTKRLCHGTQLFEIFVTFTISYNLPAHSAIAAMSQSATTHCCGQDT